MVFKDRVFRTGRGHCMHFFCLTYLLSKPFCEKQLSELVKGPPIILEALSNSLGY